MQNVESRFKDKKLINFFITLSFLFFIFCILFPSRAIAQSLSLSLSPPIVEIMIQPGRQLTLSYQLTNNSERNLTIIPSISKLQPSGDNGLITHSQIDQANPIGLAFESGEKFGQPFSLGVGETRQLVAKLAVATNALEGDYYSTLFFSTADVGYTGDNYTSGISQIGSNLLVTVSQSGKPIFSGEARFDRAPKVIDSFSPLKLDLLITNTGKTLYKPFGKVVITGWLKQRQEIDLLGQNILATSTRRFSIVPTTLGLPLGKFTIKAEFQPNQIPPVVETSTTIYYAPYKLAAGIILLIIVVKFIKRTNNKRQ